MNDLQKCELELLKYFIDICNKLNLRYYLVCGSALGAVKYGGFIPWDDDVDVALPRPDYEMFIKNAQRMLPSHVFLQNSMTDPQFPLIFSKLRNSNTTYIEEGHKKLNMHHGVYIDIFPLDGYPQNKEEIRKFEIEKGKYERRRRVTLDYNRFQYITAIRTLGVFLLYKTFGFYKDTAKTIKRYNEFLSQYNVEESKLWCNHGNWQGELEYAPKVQYGNGMRTKFEGLEVIVPEKYDEYLTQKYNAWRADIPREQQVGSHNYYRCDLKKPYTMYLKAKRKGKYEK